MRTAHPISHEPFVEVPSRGSLLLIGLALLLALSMAFCAGERSGYAMGHFDATMEVQQ